MTRFIALDGLRGVCVLIVWASHVVARFTDHPPAVPGVSWLWNGSEAVVVFFAISGFVLALPLEKGRLPWAYFVCRRFTRLYPPFFAAILLAAALALAAQGLEPARVARGVFALLTLQDTAESVPLNAPLWSMLQEFRLALIYPALYLSLRRAPAPVLLVCCGVATLAMLLPAGEIADQFYRTAVCTACFAVGAVFAIHRNALAAFAGRIPGPAWLVLLVLLWPLSCNSEAPIRLSLKWAIYLSAMAAVPIALYQPRIASLLSTRVPQYLGLISYSLYLVHQPMLDFAYPMLGRILAPAMALPLTLGLTFAVAILLFRIVEAPARHWSHARLMTPRASLDLGEVRP